MSEKGNLKKQNICVLQLVGANGANKEARGSTVTVRIRQPREKRRRENYTGRGRSTSFVVEGTRGSSEPMRKLAGL
eukprot:1153372-Pelagomonas_calceolata.AAC.4